MTPATSLMSRAGRVYVRAEEWIDKLQSLAALAIRLYLADVFLSSALTKVRDWNITLALFENEYRVPLLSPAAAALLGTAAEFALPLLLLAGLGTRLAALALFAFNAVAVISYPDLSDAGLKDHILWGTLMLVLAVYGPGKLSVDALLSRRGSPG
jgi:putative oxidoreductase